MQSATKQFINRAAIALTCFIALGILTHDTKFDKAVMYGLSLPVAIGAVSLGAQAVNLRDSTSHTHVERVHLNHAFSNMPRTQPRDDMKKYLSPRHSTQNGNFFSGSGVLWPSI